MAASDARTGFEKALAALVGVAALVASLLAVLQVDTGRQATRASLLSSRSPVKIFEAIAASGIYHDFHISSSRDASALGIEALARQIAALKVREAAFMGALGRADYAAVARLQAVAKEMEAISLESRGVDPGARAAMLPSLQDLARSVEDLNELVDESSTYSVRQSRTIIGLSLVAIAAALFGLAAVLKAGAAGRIALGVGAAALLGSAGWGAAALF